MPGTVSQQRASATQEYLDARLDSRIMAPGGPTVSSEIAVSTEAFVLKAFGLSGDDQITVEMVAGPAGDTDTATFRPAGGKIFRLTARFNAALLLYPGRYQLRRAVGAAGATVYGFQFTMTAELAAYYARTGDDAIISGEDTDSINITVNYDDPANPIVSADLNLSEDAGNIAEIRSDGLYVAQQELTLYCDNIVPAGNGANVQPVFDQVIYDQSGTFVAPVTGNMVMPWTNSGGSYTEVIMTMGVNITSGSGSFEFVNGLGERPLGTGLQAMANGQIVHRWAIYTAGAVSVDPLLRFFYSAFVPEQISMLLTIRKVG